MDIQKGATTDAESHLKENTLLRFRVGPFRFCVPAVEVEGIIVPPQLTVIPLNPPHSKGVFMHHQRLASAISLRSKFGLPDHDDGNLGQLVLGVVSVGLVGFWVDEVYETVDASELEWRDMPDFVPHAAFESFAVRDRDVVMASTMQKLYDVPAEEMASMLTSMRETYDLPADIPPVASEVQPASNDGDGDEDAFGDLTDGAEKASTTDAANSNDSANDSGADTDAAGVSRDDAADKTVIAEDSANKAPASPGGDGARSSVIKFPEHRKGSSAQPGGAPVSSASTAGNRRPDAAGTRERHAWRGQRPASSIHSTTRTSTGHSTARTSTGHSASTVRPQTEFSGREHRGATANPGTFAGGTYAGSIHRATQQARYQPDTTVGGGSRYDDSQYVDSRQHDEERKSDNGMWWLLAAALLLLMLLAYWLWPNSDDQGSVSSYPNQNYREPYSFRDSTPAPSAPVESEPVNRTEERVPVPAPQSPPAPALVSEPEPVAQQAPATAPTDTTSNEVYRLEGKDVTLTVERKRNAAEDTGATSTPQPPSTIDDNPQPGYREFVHVVVKGDTLWDIAAKYLKNPFRYPELARLSKIKNPDLIYPGDTVRIRAREE